MGEGIPRPRGWDPAAAALTSLEGIDTQPAGQRKITLGYADQPSRGLAPVVDKDGRLANEATVAWPPDDNQYPPPTDLPPIG